MSAMEIKSTFLNILPIVLDHSFARSVQSGKKGEKGGFSGSAGAYDGIKSACLKSGGYLVQHRDVLCSVSITYGLLPKSLQDLLTHFAQNFSWLLRSIVIPARETDDKVNSVMLMPSAQNMDEDRDICTSVTVSSGATYSSLYLILPFDQSF